MKKVLKREPINWDKYQKTENPGRALAEDIIKQNNRVMDGHKKRFNDNVQEMSKFIERTTRNPRRFHFFTKRNG